MIGQAEQFNLGWIELNDGALHVSERIGTVQHGQMRMSLFYHYFSLIE